MRVEDFNKPKRNGRIINNDYHFLFDIYSYNSIDYEKKELFQSIHKYIKAFPNSAELDLALGNHHTFVQCENDYGTRFLANFNLVTFLDNDCDEPFEYDSTEYISENELNNRANKYRRVGSQKYNNIGITVFDPNSSDFKSIPITIMYTEDGHVFVNEGIADIISRTDINSLGEKLVRFTNNTYSHDQTYYDNEFNKLLNIRYEKGKNSKLYQVKNGNLYVEDPYYNNDTKHKRLSAKELKRIIRK